MDNDEKKIRYLEMIQNVINRIATNSFAIKGLVVTILAAVIALTFVDFGVEQYLLLLAITLIFCFLDCYYLYLERKYRKLYDDVRSKTTIDFSMNTLSFKVNYFKTLISWSIWPFYVAVIVLPVILLFI